MLALSPESAMFALFGLGGWEMVLILALVLILFGIKGFPGFPRRLGEGFSRFRRATKDLDQEAHDAGEALGGIYGKPAAQALTHDNQTAELYDPAVFHNPRNPKRMRFRGFVRLRRLIRRFIFNCFCS
jgi:sec-independent protein translocase protein TatA